MNDEVLSHLVQQLHRALEDRPSITARDRELLERLSAELRALLAKPDAATRSSHLGIRDQLLAAVTRFEVSHPDLAATMELASKKLADMGI